MIKEEKNIGENIKITAPAPKIKCTRCGKIFISRGKKDEYAINGDAPVYCDECEKELKAKLIGGPLDGQSAFSE